MTYSSPSSTCNANHTGKRVAVVQSNYIPWKGYFDLIRSVDEFILYDDMQFTRRDWRNRNKIKTPQGTQWLTIPVITKGKYYQKIKDTVVADPEWGRKHWTTLVRCYCRAPHFASYRQVFEELYLNCQETSLSAVNYRFIAAICRILQIPNKITWSMDYSVVDGKNERLVSLCKQVGATEYISGPAAKDYIEEKAFKSAKIGLRYMEYSGYPEYRQLYPPFDHFVTVLDLIFNEGPDASKYLDRS